MQLSDVVATSRTVAATSSRTAKVQALPACLRRASEDGPDVVQVVTAHLSGVLPLRRIGVSWRGLQGLPDSAETGHRYLLPTPRYVGKLRPKGRMRHFF